MVKVSTISWVVAFVVLPVMAAIAANVPTAVYERFDRVLSEGILHAHDYPESQAVPSKPPTKSTVTLEGNCGIILAKGSAI